MRIGIIGAGVAGLTTAWLLERHHELFLFDARAQPGGHADSVLVSLPDRDVTVDLGAQYVSHQGFPAHGRLLRALGFDDDVLTPVPVTLTLTVDGGHQPLLVTPHRPDEARNARAAIGGAPLDAIGRFMEAAAAFDAADGGWETPLADLVEPLALDRRVKDDLLYPWLSHIVCCANRQAPGVSARAAIAFFVRLAPPAPDEATMWANPTEGMARIVNRLVEQLPPGCLRVDEAIHTIDKVGEGFELGDRHGRRTRVDRIVFGTPPYDALPLLAGVDGTARARLALAAFSFTPAVVAIHLDPIYMPADRRHWSTVCLDIHDGWTEASHWYGPAHGAEIFKSWITYRARGPARVIARRAFRHLVVTPAAVRARAELAACQGQAGVYFAGSHMTYIDTQESAVISAARVARLLAPDSARLATLTDGLVSPAGAA